MIRIILMVCWLAFGLVSAGQHPFNYGKTKQVYFFSKKDILRLEIKELALPSIPNDGRNNADAHLQLISFADTSDITDGWFPYYGSSTRKLTVKQLRDSSGFMNGHFYRLENGRIVESGGDGRGALCQQWYEYEAEYTAVINSCKYGVTETAYKIYYHQNGLPRFKVCCKTDSFAVEAMEPDTLVYASTDSVPPDPEYDELPFFRKKDRAWDYTDTTWYVYDSKWRIVGTRSPERVTSIFTVTPNDGEQWLVNGSRFEIFMDRKLGFRPKRVLFEIYRNAVFAFTYSEKTKTYNYNGSLMLE